MAQHLIRIGTRKSPLALAQAHEVRDRLLAAHAHLDAENIQIVAMSTSGDRILDRTLSRAGGKGLFTKELEEALLQNQVDLVVHSCKDMPTQLPQGLVLSCFLPREDVADVLISRDGLGLSALAHGATVGTASLRRQAMLLRLRPDVTVVPLRGSVDTRLAKVMDGTVDATFLARAGLNRLGRDDVPVSIMDPAEFLPAPAQGAITIEIRQQDRQIAQLLAPLNDAETTDRVTAERACLAALDGSCRTPIAALATVAGEQLHLSAMIASLDGATVFDAKGAAPRHQAAELGARLGSEIRKQAGDSFFADLAAQMATYEAKEVR